MLLSFKDLKKNIKKDCSSFKVIKAAVLGDSSTQFLTQAIKGYGIEFGFNFDLYEAEYNQIENLTYDQSSDLYKTDFDYIILFFSAEKLLKQFYKLNIENQKKFWETKFAEIKNIYFSINKVKPKSRIILYNFPEINDSVYGNFANKTKSSFIYHLRQINIAMMNLAQEEQNLFICDICALQNQVGRPSVLDSKNYVLADMVFSLDFLPLVAKNTADIILSISGVFKKALILDLDNTLWGGVIGDDGLENIQLGDLGVGKAFSELQSWILQLKQRGIILAVCSKNDEKNAKEPFEKHPDMNLNLDDIAVFVANWNSKVDNIKYIQTILNIGYDSMVFLDDNPYERNIVRTHLPLIQVPELPEDPAEYLPFLQKLNIFETASFTEEDQQRTKQYQGESLRADMQKSFTNETDFLKSLDMISEISDFNSFNVPRVAQLTQRSNQFNLRTCRYTENDIKLMSQDKNTLPFCIGLKDKFGDYGLISVIILKQIEENPKNIFIDTWLMSCRVLKRGVENFALNLIVQEAKKRGYENLIGEYIPTAKNNMVKDHYENLGFVIQNNFWILNINKFESRINFIRTESKES